MLSLLNRVHTTVIVHDLISLKTKTKVLTLANHNVAVSKRGKSRNWYRLTSDWLRRRREIFRPITNNRAITDYF